MSTPGQRYVPARNELVMPPYQPAGAIRADGEQREQAFEQADLAAEASAHRHRYDANLVRGDVELVRKLVAERERTLSRRPDRQPATGLGSHRRHVGLHRG